MRRTAGMRSSSSPGRIMREPGIVGQPPSATTRSSRPMASSMVDSISRERNGISPSRRSSVCSASAARRRRRSSGGTPPGVLDANPGSNCGQKLQSWARAGVRPAAMVRPAAAIAARTAKLPFGGACCRDICPGPHRRGDKPHPSSRHIALTIAVLCSQTTVRRSGRSPWRRPSARLDFVCGNSKVTGSSLRRPIADFRALASL